MTRPSVARRHRGWIRGFAIGTGLVVLLTSCSLLFPASDYASLDGESLADAQAALPEAGTPPGLGDADVGGETAALDGGDAASLAENGSFELVGAGCGPGWEPDRALVTPISSAPRDGPRACRVCALGLTGWFAMLQRPRSVPSGPVTLVAWLRIDGDAGERRLGISLSIRQPDGGARVPFSDDTKRFQSGLWFRFALSTVLAPGEKLYQFDVYGAAGRDFCFDVDDVSLVSE